MTVTADASAFVVGSQTAGGDVGRWLATAGGLAKITAVASATSCTVDTTVPRGAAFAGTSLSSGGWGIARGGLFWKDWLAASTNIEGFDPLGVVLDECEREGMGVIVGLSRFGDTEFLNDLYAVNILSSPDPLRYNLTMNSRVTRAVNLTREMAASLHAAYGHYGSFYGWYNAHEPDHMGASNNYFTPAHTLNGTHPALRSYGLPVMIAPSSPIDLAGTEAFALLLIASGADIISPQDSVGPGLDFVSGNYTYVQSVPLAQIEAHFRTWRIAIDIANARATSNSLSLLLWATVETWKMGITNAFTTLTLSATSGASVLVTPDLEVFPVRFGTGDFFLSSADGGYGRIVSLDSNTPRRATVDTTIPGGRAFASTSQAPNTWAVTAGYTADYPTEFSRLQNAIPSASTRAQLSEIWQSVDAVVLYAWFGFLDSGTNSLRLSQEQPGLNVILDHRTRATALHTAYKGYVNGQFAKYLDAPGKAIIQDRQLVGSLPTAGLSVTSDLGSFRPAHDGSEVDIDVALMATKVSGLAAVTVTLLVNSVNVRSQAFQMSDFDTGIHRVLRARVAAKGVTQAITVSVVSSAGNVTIGSCIGRVQEIV